MSRARRTSNRRRVKAPEDKIAEPTIVMEAGEESFPASDPPSWTLGVEKRKEDR